MDSTTLKPYLMSPGIFLIAVGTSFLTSDYRNPIGYVLLGCGVFIVSLKYYITNK